MTNKNCNSPTLKVHHFHGDSILVNFVLKSPVIHFCIIFKVLKNFSGPFVHFLQLKTLPGSSTRRIQVSRPRSKRPVALDRNSQILSDSPTSHVLTSPSTDRQLSIFVECHLKTQWVNISWDRDASLEFSFGALLMAATDMFSLDSKSILRCHDCGHILWPVARDLQRGNLCFLERVPLMMSVL